MGLGGCGGSGFAWVIRATNAPVGLRRPERFGALAPATTELVRRLQIARRLPLIVTFCRTMVAMWSCDSESSTRSALGGSAPRIPLESA